MTWRTFLLAPLLFLGMSVLSLLHIQGLAAQSAEIRLLPGTLPSGPVYLPLVANNYAPVPPPVYGEIPIAGAPIDRPAAIHGDLNLSLRSYVATTGELSLIDVDGSADADAPQVANMFMTPRLPQFTGVYQVHDWNWGCGDNGCRGQPIASPPVTLLEMTTSPGEAISIPSRNQGIYQDVYKAMVLYAEATRITLVYTRDDTAAHGYVVHIEDIVVEPALVALYQKLNDEGRSKLPALRNGERLGYANSTSLKVAVRDTGSFLDPRVRKNWWQGY